MPTFKIFTITIYPAPTEQTNEWNSFRGIETWHSMVRGSFPTREAANARAREMLLPGAPFEITEVES